jgi:molybdate transport system ATP-binding protein
LIEVAFRHAFAGRATVLEIAFQAPSPGATVLFGPSGAGKSSVVAVLAGLLRPQAGRIVLDGQVLMDSERGIFLPPERRRLGLVFQDARLFPHLRVRGNLLYGFRRVPPGPFAFNGVVDLLGIGGLLRRRPHTLSGGERQRVAIGRALLSQPRVLLMDEPLASLDRPRRDEILRFLIGLKAQLAIPLVYVTHDAAELATLADSLVLLEDGKVTASGPLTELSARPDLPLAERDDAGAILIARVTGHDTVRSLTELRLPDDTAFLVPLQPGLPGSMARLKIPARDVVLAGSAPPETSVQNVLPGVVMAIHAPQPPTATVSVLVGTARLLARITTDAVVRLRLRPGSPVFVLLKATAIDVMPS